MELRGISVSYGPIRAVAPMDLSVAAGEVVSVIGPNGAGKTSLLEAAIGLARHTGSVHLDGVDLSSLKCHARARAGLGYVPSSRGVFSSLTVRDTVRLSAGKSFNESWKKITEWFPILSEKAASLGSGLSGGQQQMLSIARALATAPSFMLMDEPSIGLSPIAVGQLVGAIQTLQARGMGVLLTEQNAGLALTVSDRCLLMVRGEVRLSGKPSELRNRPEVEALYLGRNVDPEVEPSAQPGAKVS